MDLARATLVLIRVLRTLSNSIAKNLHKLKICLRFYFFTKNSTFRLIIFWAAFASFHSAKPGFAVFHSGTGYARTFNPCRRKTAANTKATASLMSALQSIVTILWLADARITEAGTKTITSRRSAKNVDFPLFPTD